MPELTGTNKERYDKNIRRHDKLSGYYFDMSKLTFATAVLANIGIFSNEIPTNGLGICVAGIFGTVIFAYIGNRVLKF